MNIELKVEGMTCGGCSKRLAEILQKMSGVTQVDVNHTDGYAKMHIDEQHISQAQVVTAIEEAGFDVV